MRNSLVKTLRKTAMTKAISYNEGGRLNKFYRLHNLSAKFLVKSLKKLFKRANCHEKVLLKSDMTKTLSILIASSAN